MKTTIPLDFWHGLAVEVCRHNTPQATEARQFRRLIDLHRHLVEQADGSDGDLAEGLAANLLPVIMATAVRLRL